MALSVNMPVCTNPAKVRSCNEFAAKVAATARFASFGCLHPAMKGWREELRQFRSWGLIGLKIHNDYQEFFFDSQICQDMIEAAYEEGLMVLVHAGADPVSPGVTRCTPQMIAKAMPLLRQGTFIAAHLGGHLLLDDAMKYVIGSEVYIDSSMAAMYYSDIRCRQAILTHDPDRVLFGSDSPWARPGRRRSNHPSDETWRCAGEKGPLGQCCTPAPTGRGYAAPEGRCGFRMTL